MGASPAEAEKAGRFADLSVKDRRLWPKRAVQQVPVVRLPAGKCRSTLRQTRSKKMIGNLTRPVISQARRVKRPPWSQAQAAASGPKASGLRVAWPHLREPGSLLRDGSRLASILRGLVRFSGKAGTLAVPSRR